MYSHNCYCNTQPIRIFFDEKRRSFPHDEQKDRLLFEKTVFRLLNFRRSSFSCCLEKTNTERQSNHINLNYYSSLINNCQVCR